MCDSSPVRQSPLERAAWLLLGLVAAVLLHSTWRPPAGDAAAVILVAFGLLAGIHPLAGLLALAGIAPLAMPISVFILPSPTNVRFEEALVLAFLAGWGIRRAASAERPRVSALFRWSVTLLAVTCVASATVTVLAAAAQHPEQSLTTFVATLVGDDYLVVSNALFGSMLLLEGVVLALVAAEMCAASRTTRDALLRMMVVAAAAGALLNLLWLIRAMVAYDRSIATFASYLAAVRINVLFGDLNAAGSYFAMMLIASAGFASRTALGLVSTVLLIVGLWLSGSRTALVVCAVVICAVVIPRLRHRFGDRALGAFLALCVLLAAAAVMLYPEGRNERVWPAAMFRVEMAKAALQMTAGAPLFGVGGGRFYAEAEQYAGLRENAHNNLLQILAEFGLAGLLLFLAVVGIGLRGAWRARNPRQVPWICLALLASLLTGMAGHPLIEAAAAYPFWMLLGAGAASSPARAAMPPSLRAVFRLLLVALLVTTIPRALEAMRSAYLEHRGIGMSVWHHAPEGFRYRWAGGRSAFFVPSNAPAVRVPLRHGGTGPAEIEVRIFLDGREADRLILGAGAEWKVYRLRLPGSGRSLFSRVDLHAVPRGGTQPLSVEATDSSGALMVGMPVVEARGDGVGR